ncbi:AAA family ATPase [Actinoallomurus sp. CA-142502]|uniref:nSTAND1 domain-containing NTPase n=1 Tax=Actinoallomurus sp. CA-142502 TaxID=3239885 RepID=UPI003D8DCD54
MLRWSPATLLCVLCGGAFGPLVATALSVAGAGVAAAAIETAASVGGNLLADVISTGIDRLRGAEHSAGQEQIEAEVERLIGEILEAGGDRALELRSEIASVVRTVGATGAALEEAVASGDRELQALLTGAMTGLGEEFAEFRFLLDEVGEVLAAIQEELNEQGAAHRQMVDMLRTQNTDLRMMRETVAVIERRVRADDGAHPPDDPVRWPDGSPYRGLAPFEEDDGEIFYGRDLVTAELVGTLGERLAGTSLVIVNGPSGVGKSSLLRAGLLPALARGSLSPQSAAWPRVAITPARSPLLELATHLATMAGTDAALARERLAGHPDQAYLLARQAVLADANRRGIPAASAARQRLVLVVDQFEEVFAPRVEESERSAFVAALRVMAGTPYGPAEQPPAVVLIALRSDFLGRCAAYPALREALSNGNFVVGPMEEPELRQAIVGPAMAAGLRIDPGLTEMILADLRSSAAPGAYEAGALPWLSQAMLITWRHREGDRLTAHGYGRSGGVRGAIQTSAEDVYESLTGARPEIAGDLFHALTDVSGDLRLSRRERLRTDLYAGRPEAERGDVDAVLEAFAAQRLLVLSEDSVQISHDELLRSWSRLRDWLEPDVTVAAVYGRLLKRAAEWNGNGRNPSYLYRGAELVAVQEARVTWEADPARYPVTADPLDFVTASEYAAQRAARRRRAVLATLAGLTVVALIAAVTAVSAAGDANHQRALAVSRQLAAQSETMERTDPVTSALLAAAAWRTAHTDDARYAMLNLLQEPDRGAFTGHDGPVDSVAFSPDGRTLATGGADGTARLWDVATRRQSGAPLAAKDGAVSTVAFSPRGRTLATVHLGPTGGVRLWDTASRRQIGPPIATGHGVVRSARFSPDGRTIATAGDDGTVRLWDVATRRQVGAPLIAHGGTVAFSPDGRTLATGDSAGTVRLWDVATHHRTGRPITVRPAAVPGSLFRPKGVEAVAFSPDGRTLATGGADRTARLWDVAARRQIGEPLVTGGVFVNAVAFSPDGRTLATGGTDDTVRLWDVATRRQTGSPLTGHTGDVKAVAFSPDGRGLATASADRTARLWSVSVHRQTGAPLTGHGNAVYSVAYSRGGNVLATASEDRTARLWDTRTHRQIGMPVTSPTGFFYDVALSPDGRTLATGDSEGVARLWDVTAHRLISSFVAGQGTSVDNVVFSPDGRRLAATDGDGTARLWDITTHAVVLVLVDGAGIDVIAFSRDGRLLATGDADGAVRLWDARTGRRIGTPFTGHNGPVGAVAFSPDARTLATVGRDGTARLWDVATHRQIGAPLIGQDEQADAVPSGPAGRTIPTGHHLDVFGLAFSPDGRTFATAGSDGKARLWDTATHNQLGGPLIGHSGSVTDVAFGPGGGVLATAGADGTARLWDVSAPGDPPASLCAVAGRSLTRAEWDRYVPGQSFQHVCG